MQAVTWYLRYPLSYRKLESMFAERGFEVNHSMVNRWVLTYVPMIEKRLRRFRKLLSMAPGFSSEVGVGPSGRTGVRLRF